MPTPFLKVKGFSPAIEAIKKEQHSRMINRYADPGQRKGRLKKIMRVLTHAWPAACPDVES